NNEVDLKRIFTPNEKVVCYAAIWIESDKEQEKIFGIGSNDGIKAWFNGEMILKVHKPRTVNIDDEYLKLNLKKGRNLLLLKIEQGFGGWGFVLRPVDNKTAWDQVQKHLDIAMNSEFHLEGNIIKGTIGDNNIVGQLSNLPMAKVEFKAINGKHSKTIEVPVGTKLELQKSNFPANEYAITISFNTDNGVQTTYAYMNTVNDVVAEIRELMYKDMPRVPQSPMANYYTDFINTVQWLDRANKLWEHPYGYRRYLDGIKNAHKGMGKLQKSTNPFDGIFPAPRNMNFTDKKCIVDSSWTFYDPTEETDYISDKIHDFWENEFNWDINYSGKPIRDKTIVLEYTKKGIAKKEGSYLVQIDENKITIKARNRQGLFYGLSTLLQAMEQNTTLPVGIVSDFPAYPVRSVVLTKTKAVLSDDFKSYINQLSDFRYNEIYLPSDAYYYLDKSERLKEINEVFDYCKEHFIEPVPYFETFGGWTFTRVLDPCLDEGIYHEKEKYIVTESGDISLDVPRIHDCENSTIHIFDKNQKELIRGTDYKLVSTEKPVIKILNKEYFNKELLLSYDAVDFTSFPHAASCPSNPKGWKIQEKVISSVIKELKPSKLHISQDEVGFVNTCSQCKARNLTNKEIMIDQINRVHKIIRKYDKNVGIYIWGDMFNDLQNAPKIDAKGCIEGLPKDIMVHDWNYVGVYHSDKMKTVNQMNFYLNRGYKAGGVAWFEPSNILDIMLTGEKKKDQFLGIMHSAWSKFEHSLMPVAEANWTGKTILNKLGF
ncbi:MAG: glycoside hydrolase family 20 zincin-like fold domain-containing protein, partial [Bacteroidota bacterium]